MAIAQYAEVEGRYLTPNGRPAVMTFRAGTNDANTLNASMNEDEYGLRGVAVTGSMVDVGGYLGSVGIGVAQDNPDARVWIIEPVPSNLALIRANVARNGVSDRVTVIEGAVGSGPVDVWFGYRGNESAEHHAFVGNSSLAYDHGGELAHETKTYRKGITLAAILKLTGDIDLLKIDCEGGEWSFLASPELHRVNRIVGEAHAVRGHKGSDIVALLSETHSVTLSGDVEGTCGFTAIRQ